MKFTIKTNPVVVSVCALLMYILFSYICPPQCNANNRNYKKEKHVYKYLIKAEKLINKEKYDQALTILGQLTPFDPNIYSSSVHSNACKAFYYKKNYSMSIAQGLKALKFSHKETWITYYLAKSNLELNNIKMARKWLSHYVKSAGNAKEAKKREENANDLLAYHYLKKADKFLDSGKRVDAKLILEEALSLPRGRRTASINGKLAYVLLRLGNPNGTIKYATVANQLEPKETVYYGYLASAYRKIGDFDTAIAWYEKIASKAKNSQDKLAAKDQIQNLIDDKEKAALPIANSQDYLSELSSLRIWPKESMPIKVFIPIGDGIPGYRKNFPQMFFDALQEWRKASGNKISFQLLGNPNGAQVTVNWEANKIKLEQKGRMRDDKAGISRSTVGSSNGSKYPPISSSQISIQTLDSYENKPLSDDEIKSTCLHEIGHTLGFGGHSRNARDIMYYSEVSVIPALTRRDKASIKKLYENHPPVYSDLDTP